MGRESFAVVRLDLVPLLQGQTRRAKLTSAYKSLIIGSLDVVTHTTHLLLVLEVCSVKPTHRKSIMGWKSFDVVRFDLVPLLQGQTRIAKL